MSDEKFKLPGSSYDEVVKVIKGYGHHDGPVELSAISQVTVLHPTSISRNNGFLVGIGVLEGGQKKSLTPAGRALAHALDHDMSEDIRDRWREVILANDFFRKLLSAIRIRNGMENGTLQSHIAYSAGLTKSAGVMTGARTVIDILEVAGVVKDIDGKLQASATDSKSPAPSPDVAGSSDLPREEVLVGSVLVPTKSNVLRGHAALRRDAETPDVRLNIEVRIQCTPEELDGLGVKLKTLLDEFGGRQATISME